MRIVGVFLVLCMLAPFSATAAEINGSLRGVMPVPGLRIYVKPPASSAQKGLWASTDGRAFHADNLLPGNYTLVVHFGNCCGFTQDVNVRAGRATIVRLDLSRYYVQTFIAELSKAELTDLTIGPDGSKWFVEYFGPTVRIAHWDGVTLREFDLPALPVNSSVSSLTPRSDGTLWFTDGEKLERIDRDGKIQTLTKFPERIDDFAIAPDGGVWTWRVQGSGVMRYDPLSGSTRHFEVKAVSPGSENARLSVTHDGTAWYTSLASNSITRLSPDGTTSAIALPWNCGPSWVREWESSLVFSCWKGKYGAGRLDAITMRAAPLAVPGNDDSSVSFATEMNGDQWFIDRKHSSFVGVAPSGTPRTITLKSPLDAFDLTAAKNRLWYVYGRTVVGVALDGAVTTFDIPAAHRDPETDVSPIEGLVPDADGNLWFIARKDLALYRIARDGALSRLPILPKPVEMPH